MASIDFMIGGAIVSPVTEGDTTSVEFDVSMVPVGLCATE